MRELTTVTRSGGRDEGSGGGIVQGGIRRREGDEETRGGWERGGYERRLS